MGYILKGDWQGSYEDILAVCYYGGACAYPDIYSVGTAYLEEGEAWLNELLSGRDKLGCLTQLWIHEKG